MNEEDDSTPERIVALRRFVDTFDALGAFAKEQEKDGDLELAERARGTQRRLAAQAEEWFPDKSGTKAKTLNALKAAVGAGSMTSMREIQSAAETAAVKWLAEPTRENGYDLTGAIQTLWATTTLRAGEVLLDSANEFLDLVNKEWTAHRKAKDLSGKKRAEWLVREILRRFDEIVRPVGSSAAPPDP